MPWGGCSRPQDTLPGAPDTQVLLGCPRGSGSDSLAHLEPICSTWIHGSTLIRNLSSRALGLKPTKPNTEMKEGCNNLFGTNHTTSLMILMGTILLKSYWLKNHYLCDSARFFFWTGSLGGYCVWAALYVPHPRERNPNFLANNSVCRTGLLYW